MQEALNHLDWLKNKEFLVRTWGRPEIMDPLGVMETRRFGIQGISGFDSFFHLSGATWSFCPGISILFPSDLFADQLPLLTHIYTPSSLVCSGLQGFRQAGIASWLWESWWPTNILAQHINRFLCRDCVCLYIKHFFFCPLLHHWNHMAQTTYSIYCPV